MNPSSRLLLAMIVPTLLTAPLSAAQPDWTTKVDPWVLDTVATGVATEMLVMLDAQADLSPARNLRGKDAKGRFVFERLTEVAERTQGPLRGWLTARAIEHQPMWIANMIWVRGDAEVIEQIAQRTDVKHLYANPWSRFDPGTEATTEGSCPAGGVEASLTHVDADLFWNQGIIGQGVVIGGQDTGYDWDHPALRDQYRGWNGATVDHDYSWHDSIHSGGGVCGADSSEPCDDNNHGTHTMGTMVGDTGGNRLGMAPGARWVGCRNMDRGNGTPTTYSECFQWFVAPTDVSGQNPDPSQAPDVVNNSWICVAAEGCTDPNVLLTVVENARAAGIVVVGSAGNSGSGCSSITSPPATYEATFTVGAVNNSDQIAGFSSRGPVTADGSNRLKPDISAPGVGICSSTRNGGYSSFNGTSMAGPHVAGLVALLISAQPCLRGDVDAIEDYIRDTSVPQTSTQTCGGVAGTTVPNNTFGYGAIRAVMPDSTVCGGIFVDGFESGDTSLWTISVP